MAVQGDDGGIGGGRSSSPDPPEDAAIPQGLTAAEYGPLRPAVDAHHRYRLAGSGSGERRCSSILAQRVRAPAAAVWSVVRRFDHPQAYKHFIRSCSVSGGVEVGCLREVRIISGLPASTSVERLDVLDEARRVFGFSIVGGEHRLRNYKSVTTVSEGGSPAEAVVVESYAVDVPEGNTEEDTRLFADTVVRLNLQKLAAAAEAAVVGGDASDGFGGR